MMRDLLEHAPDGPVRSRVVIVGAGIAGLMLAHRFDAAGIPTVVLESGGLVQDQETHPLNEVVQTADDYRGALHGRFRCLGGTSTRWGGALIPMLREEIGPHPLGWTGGWGIDPEELYSYIPEVERIFDLPPGPFRIPSDGPLARGHSHSPPELLFRLAKWPTFRKRNVANVFSNMLKRPRALDIWLNATVTAFDTNSRGRLTGVVAKARNGHEITVHADHTFIAAGAIEATRLLLLLNRQHEGRVFAEEGPLGRYFYDHISTHVARIKPKARSKLVKASSFRFEKKGMRSLRFEIGPFARLTHSLPAGFANIVFETDGPSGFDALRSMYQSTQRGSFPSVRDAGHLMRQGPWLLHAAYWRFFKKRLLPPTNALFALNLVTEQEPAASNRITLSAGKEVDPFGLPLASIHWRVSSEDEAGFNRAKGYLVDGLRKSGFEALAEVQPVSPDVYLRQLRAGGGIYHPGGSTRIGAQRMQGVVDSNLHVHEVPGLSVVSTSIFPNGGASNPTMTLMLIALRAADHHIRSLGV